MNSGLSLIYRSAFQTQDGFSKEYSFSGFLAYPLQAQQALSNPPHISEFDDTPSALLGSSVFYLLPVLQAGAFPKSSVPLNMETASGGPGHQDCEFSLLCSSSKVPRVLPVGSAWCCVPQGHCSLMIHCLPPLAVKAHPCFLHLTVSSLNASKCARN